MLSEAQVEAASVLLWRHWREGRRLPALPLSLRPSDRAEGYAIQARLEQRSAAPLFGWKIAATSAAGQAHIGVDGPLAGRLLQDRVYMDAAELPFGANHMRVAELEFAFRMARDLAPRERPYTTAEILAAVDALHPAVEVPDSRYDDYARVGAPQLLADNACAHLFVLGPPAAGSWRFLDLAAHGVRGAVSGSPERVGIGANVLGDPRTALTWLVNELSGLRVTLAAGQVVTTGTCLPPMQVSPGDHVRGDFGVLGSVSLRFSR